MAPGPRLTLADLPPAARAIASATTDAIAATRAGDPTAFDDACDRLLLADPEHTRVILGDTVRLLLEEVLPDGVDGDDLREIIGRGARTAAPWFPGVDPGVMVVVLSGALGIHPDSPPDSRTGEERPPEPDDPWDAVPPRPSAASVTQHAVVLLADLLSVRGRPLRGYLEAAFTEMARRETVEQP
ncbi:hypothetical protein BLA60_04345 [Actinophytocola xinjiangensis]|uniref:Uncharacterized protein n=1 Tax=Actinophytocola xinjiangensis TaxID=485602 RepID=A0A7Z1B0Z9_9PSEU|nr:hypothetical protein [Actinophytocola xinjiangensis]OLF14363.1 hypothetical protein BLA60_04345 [Actinophytocola xinjiangensis]